jgi:pimeloyl-ACP methyl ester carboxylesterase
MKLERASFTALAALCALSVSCLPAERTETAASRAAPAQQFASYGSNPDVGGYQAVDDVRLYYEVYGEGEPLLLIHGNGGSISSFSLQISALSEHFRVIAVDSRAQGRSTDSDKELTYALLASDMAALLDALAIGSAHVVGWSDGGIVGLEMAHAFPERVRRLVSINPNFTAEPEAFYGLGEELAREFDLTTLTARQHEVRALIRELGTQKEALSPHPERLTMIRTKLDRLMEDHPNFTLEQIASIETPTLVMVGDHDLIREAHTLALFQTLSQAQLAIVPGATHFFPVEKPELTNGLILDFLREPYRETDRVYPFR